MDGFKMNALSFGESSGNGDNKVVSKITPLQLRGMRAKQLINSIFAQPFCCGHDTQTYSLTYLYHKKSTDKNFNKICDKFGMLVSDVCELEEHRYTNVGRDVETFINYLSELDGINIDAPTITKLLHEKYAYYSADMIEQVDRTTSFYTFYDNIYDYMRTYLNSGSYQDEREAFYNIIDINCRLAMELGCGCINLAKYLVSTSEGAGYGGKKLSESYGADTDKYLISRDEFKKIVSLLRKYDNKCLALLNACQNAIDFEPTRIDYQYARIIGDVAREARRYYRASHKKFLNFKSDVYNIIQKNGK